jgi:hypothetical protein
VEFYDIQAPAGCDRDTFESEICVAGKPSVFRGLVAHWPCVQAARQSDGALAGYLKQIDAGNQARTMLCTPDRQGYYFYDEAMRGFNFETREIAFVQIIEKLIAIADEAAPMGIYAGSLGATGIAPRFALENPMPLLPPDIEPRLWLGNRSRVAAHYDIANNIACAVAGKRRFTLFPPDQIGNLYIGPLDFNMAGQPVSLVDILSPDLDRFPKFEQAMDVAIVVELEPGDALFLPAMWWHHVEAEGPFNLLVNYWWPGPGDGPAFESMVLALLGLRDRNPAEKAAWRAFFEHYVFSDEAGHAGDHIPEHARSVLGPPSEERKLKLLNFAIARLSQR